MPHIRIVLVFCVAALSLHARPIDYKNFQHFLGSNVEGKHFRIRLQRRSTTALILAIHGGNIEPFTSELGELVAKDDFSYYTLEGLRDRATAFHLTHLTSANFDEPRALQLAKESHLCVSLHGFTSKIPKQRKICVGGNHVVLARSIIRRVEREFPDLVIEHPCGSFKGTQPTNIVNQCLEQGTQIEISRTFRDYLKDHPKAAEKFAQAVRGGIFEVTSPRHVNQPTLKPAHDAAK